MSIGFIPMLIIASFILVIIAVVLLLIKGFSKRDLSKLMSAHYLILLLAGIVYLVPTLLVLFDKRGWSQFKTELLILLLVFAFNYLGIYLAKYKRQPIFHYFLVLILIIIVAVMHFRWSGISLF